MTDDLNAPLDATHADALTAQEYIRRRVIEIRERLGLADDDLRREAESTLRDHDPSQQPDNGYLRCERCHYTRHPCDAYSMADAVIRLLDRLA